MVAVMKKLSRLKEYLDSLIAASTMAQAGEVQLARKMMIAGDEKESCCREIHAGRDCLRL